MTEKPAQIAQDDSTYPIPPTPGVSAGSVEMAAESGTVLSRPQPPVCAVAITDEMPRTFWNAYDAAHDGPRGLVYERTIAGLAAVAPLIRAAVLEDAYRHLWRHAHDYRDARVFRRANERWQANRDDERARVQAAVHRSFARGIEAGARDLAALLGVPEHEIDTEQHDSELDASDELIYLKTARALCEKWGYQHTLGPDAFDEFVALKAQDPNHRFVVDATRQAQLTTEQREATDHA